MVIMLMLSTNFILALKTPSEASTTVQPGSNRNKSDNADTASHSNQWKSYLLILEIIHYQWHPCAFINIITVNESLFYGFV
jgi:hypothetical protein